MKSSVSLLHKFKLTFVGILLAGLCWLMPSQAHAQSGTTAYGLYDAPAGPYASSPVALSRVEAQILLIKSQLQNLSQGSQDFKDLTVKQQFYSIIYDQLKAGKTTKESLEAGLKFFGTDVASVLSKTKKEQYKQEAITLLKP
jgi:hypothetical protein